VSTPGFFQYKKIENLKGIVSITRFFSWNCDYVSTQFKTGKENSVNADTNIIVLIFFSVNEQFLSFFIFHSQFIFYKK